MVGMPTENNAGSVSLVDVLIAGVIRLPDIQKNVNGLDVGWLKVILSGNWQSKVDIA